MERGKLSALNNKDLSKYKDFHSLDEVVNKYTVDKLVNVIIVCKTDREIFDKLGDKIYKLIKFALKSNKTSMRPCGIINNFVINAQYSNDYNKQKYMQDIDKFVQFEVNHNGQIEQEFQDKVKIHSNLYLFHGSSYENWYSIMRNGLKICSGSALMTAGAAHGTGIYLSNDINLSLGYTGLNAACIFGVYEVLNIPSKLHRAHTIFVAKDEKMLLLRYLFIPPSHNFIRQLDLNKVLNEKFSTKIIQEKKVVAKRSSNLRTKRLFKEYTKLCNSNSDELGFHVELVEEDTLDVWRILITNFDNNPKIKQDLDKIGVKEIEMEMRFPDRYPIEPPFIRLVSPRFVYRTGHITSGGSICMELLTKSGWTPMCSIESLMVDIKCQIVEGDGQIDMKIWRHKYTLREAQD